MAGILLMAFLVWAFFKMDGEGCLLLIMFLIVFSVIYGFFN